MKSTYQKLRFLWLWVVEAVEQRYPDFEDLIHFGFDWKSIGSYVHAEGSIVQVVDLPSCVVRAGLLKSWLGMKPHFLECFPGLSHFGYPHAN